jgi:hypothetical protein
MRQWRLSFRVIDPASEDLVSFILPGVLKLWKAQTKLQQVHWHLRAAALAIPGNRNGKYLPIVTQQIDHRAPNRFNLDILVQLCHEQTVTVRIVVRAAFGPTVITV